jgi:hypothetical protein
MIIDNSLDKTSIRPISGYHRDNYENILLLFKCLPPFIGIMKMFHKYLNIPSFHQPTYMDTKRQISMCFFIIEIS